MTPTYMIQGVYAHAVVIQSLPGAPGSGITGVLAGHAYRLETMLRASGFTVPDRQLVLPANLSRGADLALLVELLVGSDQIVPPPVRFAFFGGLRASGEVFPAGGAVAAAAALADGAQLITAVESAVRVARVFPGHAQGLAHLRDLRGVPRFSAPVPQAFLPPTDWSPQAPRWVSTLPAREELCALVDPNGSGSSILWQVQDVLQHAIYWQTAGPIARPQVKMVLPGDFDDRCSLLQTLVQAYRGVVVIQHVDQIPLALLREVLGMCRAGWVVERDAHTDQPVHWPVWAQVIGVSSAPLSPDYAVLFPPQGTLP